jgi:hypothetical protein
MLATAPTIHNRIAGHFAPAPIPVPATPDGKQAAWGEAVFAAALFYQARLAHPDPEVAERAARAIFDLEKTRLRHGRDLAGATVPEPIPPKEEFYEPLPPLPELSPIEETMRAHTPQERKGAMPTALGGHDSAYDGNTMPTQSRGHATQDSHGTSASQPGKRPRQEFTPKDLAVADAVVRQEKYQPILDEMTAKIVAHGVDADEARRQATEAFRQEVLEMIRERHERRAGGVNPPVS